MAQSDKRYRAWHSQIMLHHWPSWHVPHFPCLCVEHIRRHYDEIRFDLHAPRTTALQVLSGDQPWCLRDTIRRFLPFVHLPLSASYAGSKSSEPPNTPGQLSAKLLWLSSTEPVYNRNRIAAYVPFRSKDKTSPRKSVERGANLVTYAPVRSGRSQYMEVKKTLPVLAGTTWEQRRQQGIGIFQIIGVKNVEKIMGNRYVDVGKALEGSGFRLDATVVQPTNLPDQAVAGPSSNAADTAVVGEKRKRS